MIDLHPTHHRTTTRWGIVAATMTVALLLVALTQHVHAVAMDAGLSADAARGVSIVVDVVVAIALLTGPTVARRVIDRTVPFDRKRGRRR